MKWPDLSDVLSGIPWAAVGAVATRLYIPERMTRDLDIVVTVAQSAEARERLSRAGWTLLGSLSIGRTAWRSPEGQEVDVIEVTEGWWAGALQ